MRKIILLISFSLISIVSIPNNKYIPILSDVLNDIANAVNSVIARAQVAGQILEIEAGGQILTAISQMRQSFHSELELDLNQISNQVTNTLQSLQSIENDFVNHVYSDARDIENRAQAMIHNLPFSKHFPQLISWDPNFLAPSDDNSKYDILSRLYKTSVIDDVEKKSNKYPVKVELKSTKVLSKDSFQLQLSGDFYDLAHKNYKATIKVNNQTYTSVNNDNNEIDFFVPKNALIHDENHIRRNDIEISIPYKKNVFLFFTKKDYAHFNVPVTTLPKSMGKIEITITSPTQSTITQTFKSPLVAQLSESDDIICGGEHPDQALHCIAADPTWTIIPSSVYYEMALPPEGDWQYVSTDHSTLGEACICFNTRHHRFSTSGKIWYFITYTAQKDIISNVDETHTINLNWGGQTVLEIPVGSTWKGTYTSFDGSAPVSFAGAFSNTYLKVTQIGNIVTFKAIP